MASEIINIYKTYGKQDYIGEEITQIEHALQAAKIAEEKGYDDYMIVGALLHDIGHLIPESTKTLMQSYGVGSHEDIGADYLQSLNFPAKVVDLVRQHVNTKRYLVGADPEYEKTLSNASKETLKFQGGPMDLCDQISFQRNQWFQDHIKLRHIDDSAKVPDCKTKTIDEYKQIISNMLTPSNQ